MDSNSVHHTPAKRRLQDSGCSGDNKLPRRFFGKGREPSFEKSIVYHSNGDLMDLMEINLGDTALKRILDSPLGMFYKFYKLGFTWASRIVQHTLAYQIECQKPYEIWCVFGRHPLRFSVAEFQTITGLNCDNIPHLIRPKAEETDQEKEKFYGFWEKLQTPADRGPNKKRLQLALRSCKDWEEEDKVRLGYLSIYVQYIQGMGPRDNSNLELTKMVMNLRQFEGYPWGRVAFYYLIKSVKELNMCARQLTLKGFVQALQVWVYMALPEFGEKYGSKIAVSEPTPPILSYRGSYKRKNFAKSIMKQTVKTCCFLNRESQDELPPWEADVPDKKIDELVCRIRENHPFAESDWSGKGVYDDGFSLLPGDRRPAKKMRTASEISNRTPSPNEQHHSAALIPADLISRPEFRLAFLLIIAEKRTRQNAERAAAELRRHRGDRKTVNNRRLGEYHIAEGYQDGKNLEKLSDVNQKDKVLVGEEDREFGIGDYNRPETKQTLSLGWSSSHGDLIPVMGTGTLVLDDGDDCSPVDEDRCGWDTRHQIHKTTAGNEELCVVPLEPGRTTVKAADDPETEKISQLKILPTTDAATIGDAEGSKEIFGQGGYRPMGGDLKSDVDKGPSKWDSRCVERTTVKAPDDPVTEEFKQLKILPNTEAATSAYAEGWSEGMDVVKQEVDCGLNSQVDKGPPNWDTGCVERTTVKAPNDPEPDKFGQLKIEAATYADAEGSEGGLEQGGYRPMDEQYMSPLGLHDFPYNSQDVESPLNLDTRRFEMPACAHERVTGEGVDVIKSESTNDSECIALLSNPIRERDSTKQLEVGVPTESVNVMNTKCVEVPSESIPDTRSVLSGVAGNDPGNTHIANNSNQKLAATKDPSTEAQVSAVLFPEGVSLPIDVVEPDCTTPGVAGVKQEPLMLPKTENEELVSKSEPETISCRIVSVPNDEENVARRKLTDKKSNPPRQRQSKALINPSDHKKMATHNRMNTRKRAAQLKKDREMVGEAPKVQPADDKSEVKKPIDRLEQYTRIGQYVENSCGDETHKAVRRETLDAQLAGKKAGNKTAVKSPKQGAGKSQFVETSYGDETHEAVRRETLDAQLAGKKAGNKTAVKSPKQGAGKSQFVETSYGDETHEAVRRETLDAQLAGKKAGNKTAVKSPKQGAGKSQFVETSYGDETHEAVRRETLDAQLAGKKAGKKTAVKSLKQGAGKRNSAKTAAENEEIDSNQKLTPNTHIANNSNQKLAATKDPSTDAHVEVSAVLFPEGVSLPIDVVEPDCTTPGLVGVKQEPLMLPKTENEELVSKSEPETISCRIVSVPNDEENAARRKLTDKKSNPPSQRQSKALINPSDHKKKATPNRMITRKRSAQLKKDREMIGEAPKVQPADDKSEVKKPIDRLKQYTRIGQYVKNSCGEETHEAVRRETLDDQPAGKKAGKKTAVKSEKQGAGKSNSAKTASENEEIDRVDPLPEGKNWKDYVLKTPDHEEVKILLDALKTSGNRGSSWIKTLRHKGKWLEDTHMDLAMDVFRTRYALGRDKFKDVGMAFLGTDFTTAWNANYENFLDARKAGFISLPAGTYDYFHGKVKKTGQLEQAWVAEVSDLYCPLQIPKNHWVAMHVDLILRKITIWDSNILCKFEKEIEQAVKPYQDMFPATVKEIRKDDGYSLEPFQLQRVNDGTIPQNLSPGGGDSGVYALKFIECHAIGKNMKDLVGKLGDFNIKGMRDRLALDIYNVLGFYG